MTNIVVIGVGALGSHLVQFLRGLDAEITIIDFDRVEQKNTLSQFHSASSVGKSKVQALQQLMSFVWKTKLQVVPHKLTADNVQELLGKADLVVDCLDNAEARLVVQAFVRAKSIPCLHGALGADGSMGRVVWDEQFRIDSEAGMGGATCEDGAHLPFIGMVSTYMARSVQEFLTSGRKLGWQVYPLSAATRF